MIDRDALSLTCLIPNYHSLVHFISLGLGRATGLLWLHFLARAAKRDFFLANSRLVMSTIMLLLLLVIRLMKLIRLAACLILYLLLLGKYLCRFRRYLLLLLLISG